MKRKLVLVSIFGKILLLLGACMGIGAGPPEDSLSGTAWELQFYRKSGVIGGTRTTAIFEDGQVRGSAGCNTYRGVYQVEGDQITVGPLAITEMACLEPAGLMDQEALFMEYMAAVRTVTLVDDRLQLSRPDGEALTFVPLR